MDREAIEMLATLQEERPDIRSSRQFRRNVGHGMKVWRSETRNFTYDVLVEHITLECPHYHLTDRGPALNRKEKDDE